MARRKLSNPLALAVMAQLGEGPKHPYEIAQVLRQRGLEHTIKINFGSLYTVVQNLEKHGFVEVTGVQRQGNRPERTLYGLTDAGREELHDWLADLLAVPVQEFPVFASALSLMLVLPPDEAVALLEQRAGKQELLAAGIRGTLAALRGELPRVFIVETEFALHMVEAEARWVRGLVAEIKEGTLSGADGWREFHETGEAPQQWAELDERTRGSWAADRAGEGAEATGEA